MTFHTHDGWHFERLHDGSVEITHRDAGGNVRARHVLTPEAWASVVSSMSLRGETGARFCAALAFHQDHEP